MKPYILLSGSDDNITAFEDKVSTALEQGYELSGDLVIQPIQNGSAVKTMLFQALVFEEILEFDEDDVEFYESELADESV